VATLVITQDRVLGFVMSGELQLHEKPPFDPNRMTPSATAVCSVPRRFGDIVAQLRRGLFQNTPFRAVLGVPGGAAVEATWKVVGVVDEMGMQHQGWQERRLVLEDGRVVTDGTRVKRYVSVGTGEPVYYLAARLYDWVGELNLRPVL
jgi:hypothetical protein